MIETLALDKAADAMSVGHAQGRSTTHDKKVEIHHSVDTKVDTRPDLLHVGKLSGTTAAYYNTRGPNSGPDMLDRLCLPLTASLGAYSLDWRLIGIDAGADARADIGLRLVDVSWLHVFVTVVQTRVIVQALITL